MSNSEKRSYHTPALTVHGNVNSITRESTFENADTPQGNAGTAEDPSGFPQ